MPKRNGQGIELLADPTRRAIVARLALEVVRTNMGLQPSKIALHIGRSRPATSRQLGPLHKAGLISVRKHFFDGRRVVYFIDPGRLGQITAWLSGTELARAFPPDPRSEVIDPSDSAA